LSLQIYPKEIAKYDAGKHIWKLKNGSIIEFGYCDAEKDVTKYQSAEYDIIRFDELTHFSEFQYQYLLSRIRGVNNYPKQAKSTTNPGGVGHMWVKQRFIDNHLPNVEWTDKAGRRFIFIPAKVTDNKFLMQSDPDYIKRLEQLPENERKALLDGSWDIFEGQVFIEFRRDIHVIEPFEIPEHWRRFRSIDWGYNDPTCVLWHAVDTEGRVTTYRELYINHTAASDVAKLIVEMSKGENIEYTVASPDMWQKRGLRGIEGESIAETFLKCGVPLIPADNQRILGWQRIHEYLKIQPDGLPLWRCFSTCSNLIRTLPAAVYDKNKPEDIDPNCEDHALESLRYFLMSRPRKSIIVEPKTIKIIPFDPLRTPKKHKKNFMHL